MNDTASDAIVPDAIAEPGDPFAALGLPPGMLGMAARAMGFDPDALAAMLDAPADLEAPTLTDVVVRLDDIDDKLTQLVAHVERIVSTLDQAAPKLKRLGITWRS